MKDQLREQKPFSLLPEEVFDTWIKNSRQIRYKRVNSFSDQMKHPGLILVLKGDVRLIAFGDEQEGPFSLDKRGPGQLLGWASLLREYLVNSYKQVQRLLPYFSRGMISYVSCMRSKTSHVIFVG